jgi:hypothetical protein
VHILAKFEVVHIISPLWTRKPPVPDFPKTLKKRTSSFHQITGKELEVL